MDCFVIDCVLYITWQTLVEKPQSECMMMKWLLAGVGKHLVLCLEGRVLYFRCPVFIYSYIRCQIHSICWRGKDTQRWGFQRWLMASSSTTRPPISSAFTFTSFCFQGSHFVLLCRENSRGCRLQVSDGGEGEGLQNSSNWSILSCSVGRAYTELHIYLILF